MEYKIREIRPGEAKQMNQLARPNFSVVEQLFMSNPKFGIAAETSDGNTAGGAFLVEVMAGKQKVGCVDIIFVLPEYRGSGVAKLLYHAAVETLHKRGCTTVMALVRGDNSQSLRRFQAEGLQPISLYKLQKKIGLKATAMLFLKTASLACATGCWVLCEQEKPLGVGGTGINILKVFTINTVFLSIGALIGFALHTESTPTWNTVASLFFLIIITFGETLGRFLVGGMKKWQYIMPEGGLIPTAIVAFLGGFYPMVGHWYLAERENSKQYRKEMAAPAVGAWLLVLLSTLLFGILNEIHPFFAAGSDIGMMLSLIYMLPFYPFDTFGSRRVKESNHTIYGATVTFSIIILALLVWGV